jgi:YidC/Oxa1 family membrane protein insertase
MARACCSSASSTSTKTRCSRSAIEVENKGGAPVSLFPYGQVVRQGKPATLGYYVLHEGLIGNLGEQGLQEFTYDHVDKEPLLSPGANGKVWKDATAASSASPTNTGRCGGRPRPEAAANMRPATPRSRPAAAPTRPISSARRSPSRRRRRRRASEIFAGAKEVAAIDGYEKNLGIKRFDLLIDWGWFYFITKPMFFADGLDLQAFGNFGIAILGTTLSSRPVLPARQQILRLDGEHEGRAAEMVEIRERNADDKMKQQQATMELYKTEKINPIAGCWPVLLQIPVFFSLYKVIYITIEMRHAPFFGWIQDLAAPDPTSIVNLFGLLPFTPAAMLHLGVWPLIMGVTMFLQMRMNPTPPDPVQAMIFTWMPVFFTFMLGSFPAGLVIYWAWNNTLSVIQQGYIMKRTAPRSSCSTISRACSARSQPRQRHRRRGYAGQARQQQQEVRQRRAGFPALRL